MNSVLTCLLAVSLCAGTSFARGANDPKSPYDVAARADARGRVELTTTIIRQWSCFPDSLELALKLSFRNAGAEPVILSKRILLGRIIVSRTPEDAAARKYELSLRYTDFPGEDEPGFGFNTPTDLTNFVVLRPGEVYESEESVSFMTYLPALHRPRPHPEVDLRDGIHFLQIGVGTWPYVADADPIQDKWKDKGLLWTQGLLSAPMPFTADKDEPATKCPPPNNRGGRVKYLGLSVPGIHIKA
jgi:hypothetical protein